MFKQKTKLIDKSTNSVCKTLKHMSQLVELQKHFKTKKNQEHKKHINTDSPSNQPLPNQCNIY